MPQPSADRLISRITALHKSLQLDEGGKVSTMERDLMLGYLRELYEIYAAAGTPLAPARPQTVAPAAPKPKPTPPPAPRPTPPPAVQAPPSPPPPPKPKPAPIVAPPPVPKPTPPPPAPTPAASGELAALFAEDSNTSSRFGRQPLADLTKGLGINSRILFTKDLFGGENDLLNTTLRTLNASGSMAAAQPVLESLARRYDWQQEEKIETAKEFIELVRRRYT